jgi:hypothetical protein
LIKLFDLPPLRVQDGLKFRSWANERRRIMRNSKEYSFVGSEKGAIIVNLP